MVSSELGQLSDPAPSVSKKGRKRGNYIRYTPEQHASIGKYALENGKERPRHHFQSTLPNLTKSTIRNFKKAYKERLEHETKQAHPKAVTAITTQPKGRPPILLELDGKLLQYLRVLKALIHELT